MEDDMHFVDCMRDFLRDMQEDVLGLPNVVEFLTERMCYPRRYRAFAVVLCGMVGNSTANVVAQVYACFMREFPERCHVEDEMASVLIRDSRRDPWAFAKFKYYIEFWSGEESLLPLCPSASLLHRKLPELFQSRLRKDLQNRTEASREPTAKRDFRSLVKSVALLDDRLDFEQDGIGPVPSYPDFCFFNIGYQCDKLELPEELISLFRCLEFDKIDEWRVIVAEWPQYLPHIKVIVPMAKNDRQRDIINPMEAAIYFRAEQCIAYCLKEYPVLSDDAKYYWSRIFASPDQFAFRFVAANKGIIDYLPFDEDDFIVAMQGQNITIFEWLMCRKKEKLTAGVMETLAEVAIEHMNFDVYKDLLENGVDTEFIHVPIRYIGGLAGGVIEMLNHRHDHKDICPYYYHADQQESREPLSTVPETFSTMDECRKHWRDNLSDVTLKWKKEANTETRWCYKCSDETCSFRLLYVYRKKPEPAVYCSKASILFHRSGCRQDPECGRRWLKPREIVVFLRSLFSDRIPDVGFLKNVLELQFPEQEFDMRSVEYIRRLGKEMMAGTKSETVQKIYEMVQKHENDGWRLENHYDSDVLVGFTMVAPWTARVFRAYSNPVITDATFTSDHLTILFTLVLDGENITQLLTVTVFHRETAAAYICLFTPLRELCSAGDELTIIGDETTKIDKMIRRLFSVKDLTVTRKVCAKHKLDNIKKHIICDTELSEKFYATARGDETIDEFIADIETGAHRDVTNVIQTLRSSYPTWGPGVGKRRGYISTQRVEMMNSLGKRFSTQAIFIIDRVVQFATKWHTASSMIAYPETQVYTNYAVTKLKETIKTLIDDPISSSAAHTVKMDMTCSCSCLTDQELPCRALISKMLELGRDPKTLIGESWTVAKMREAYGNFSLVSPMPHREESREKQGSFRHGMENVTPIQVGWYSAQLCLKDTNFLQNTKDLISKYIGKHILETNIPKEFQMLEQKPNTVRHKPIRETLSEKKRHEVKLSKVQEMVCQRLDVSLPKEISLTMLAKFCSELAQAAQIPIRKSHQRTRPQLWNWMLLESNWKKIEPLLFDKDLPIPSSFGTPCTAFHREDIALSEDSSSEVEVLAEQRNGTNPTEIFDLIHYIEEEYSEDTEEHPHHLFPANSSSYEYSSAAFGEFTSDLTSITFGDKGLPNKFGESCFMNSSLQTLSRIDRLADLAIHICMESSASWAQPLLRVIQWIRSPDSAPDFDISRELEELWNSFGLDGWNDTGEFFPWMLKQLVSRPEMSTCARSYQEQLQRVCTITVREIPCDRSQPELTYHHYFMLISPHDLGHYVRQPQENRSNFVSHCISRHIMEQTSRETTESQKLVDLPAILYAVPRDLLRIRGTGPTEHNLRSLIFTDQIVAGHIYRLAAVHLQSDSHAICILHGSSGEMLLCNDALVRQVDFEAFCEITNIFWSVRGMVWMATGDCVGSDT